MLLLEQLGSFRADTVEQLAAPSNAGDVDI